MNRPVPTAIRQLRGNPGKRAYPKDEPKPPVHLPRPPRTLGPIGRRRWYRVGRVLERMRVMTDADLTALELLCLAYERMIAATEAARQEGLVIMGAKQPIVNPNVTIAQRAANEIRLLLGEFGLTPSSRTRVAALPEEEIDPFAQYLAESGVTDVLDE